jgi:predicted MFS family arabinose efflux permease
MLAGIGSTVCTLLMVTTGAGASTLGLAALAAGFGVVGIGWNGVQHTWLAELAGPRAAGTAVGLGLALSSAGVTLGPLLFGYVVQETGGYRWPWLGLASAMVAALGLLSLVRERRRPTEVAVAQG